jgi:hypothetical protein
MRLASPALNAPLHSSDEKRRCDLPKRARICDKDLTWQMLFAGTVCRHLYGEQKHVPLNPAVRP